MKKTLKTLSAVALAAVVLSGCSPSPKAPNENITPAPTPRNTDTQQRSDGETQKRYDDVIEKIISKLPIAGVQRRFVSDPFGVYTVEYIHAPRENDRDETLDYRLELKNDNTFSLNVTSDGVKAEHYGHWYMHRGGNISMYYDEPLDPTAHNVYVSDCLYGEMLCGGKLMIYENCNVVVLSRDGASDTETTPSVDYDHDIDGGMTVPHMFLSRVGG